MANSNYRVMKTIIAIIFLISLTSPVEAQLAYSWSQQNSGASSILYTCKAVSDQICWAAGTGGTVRRTTDGGITWINANPNPGVINGTIRNMEALDATTAWVATENSNTTTIYKTSTGGNNWSIVYSSTGGLIKGIRMSDATNGIAIGSPVNNLWNVVVTTDGGNTWNAAPNPPPAQFIHQGAHNSFQVDGQNIYWGTSITSIFRSTNGGVDYTENETHGAGIYVFSLRFNSNGIGLAAGTSMSRSTDGGVTFQPHSVPGAGNIDGIESVDDNFWYIRGTKVYHSTDNGVNWTDEYTAPQSLFHMDFPDSTSTSSYPTGWAVGIGGHIHKMTSISTGIGIINSNVPEKYSLGQNFPNPFNPVTKFEFELPVSSDVKIEIYDISGRIVNEYSAENLSAGKYQYEFSGADLASGVYFYKLVSDGFTAVRKMVLMK
jgi:photosystem II stability/assembly factor-like uncharacterized protein